MTTMLSQSFSQPARLYRSDLSQKIKKTVVETASNCYTREAQHDELRCV